LAEKGAFIQQLPREGVVTFLAVVKEKELRPKRNGGFYLQLVFADRTGDLDAKVWDNPRETGALFDVDDIVKVRGAVEVYNDRPQLIVQRIRKCEAGEFQETDFCLASKHDPVEMLSTLCGFAESVGDPCIRVLLRSILDNPEVAEPLKMAPAAMRLHHPYRSGLADHLVSICEAAEVLAQKYPRLNRDWLIAGAILHDLGRSKNWEPPGVWPIPREGSCLAMSQSVWGSSRSIWAASLIFPLKPKPSSNTSLSVIMGRSRKARCGHRWFQKRSHSIIWTRWMHGSSRLGE